MPALDEIESDDPEALTRCINFIESRLHQKDVPRWFKVNVEMLVGRGLNIFPAQEVNVEEKSEADNKSKKNRQGRAFKKGTDENTGRKDIPLIEKRHILYALFTSDASYVDKEVSAPINTNPSGFVYDEGKHYRDYTEGNSLYNYQEQLDELIKELEKVDSAQKIPEHIHYLVTNYIKGGFFGD
ncbi:type I-F CRISPR-associated protein Cas7f/Csy3 [Endozoicomonas sp. SCSIO W0465]|uniref:type I-F CRISPR-associated protein Cas7f/Csy3 n=1 Tax=Endozoicomonas sp. SCSIO W0465 TaxID=2918516 RepID=UPI00207540DA|nr:type I-F CRISPR-associated protein Cas7f/Csy3 [Endozoicomonas sp. SCSIO W0465]USE34451.1 type I-F CRISPR-associated protein Cas7f/Csy3 [Endozoicomonas sp. SCSIO W0465]